jgi:hypothetical protein
MPRFTRVQSAHTYGVLDPLVIERRDTKFVDGSLADALNVIMLPQGGYTDRGGTDDYGRVRRQLALRPWTEGQATLPNGGSVAGLLAGSQQTTGTVSGSRYVLAEIDFGTPTAVAFIDIGLVSVSTTGAEAALVAEYWNGTDWTTYASALLLTTKARTRRFAGNMSGVTATKYRVYVNAAAGAAGTASFSSLNFFGETDTLSAARLTRYHYRASEVHQLVVSDRNIDVFQDGAWVAAVSFPAGEAIIADVKFEFAYDTILCFHQDMSPQRITRLGTAAEWSCEEIEFENMPLVDYGGTYTNGVNEVQDIQLYGFTAGDNFQLIVEGKATASIQLNADTDVTRAAIAAALEALPNVNSGLTVTYTGGVYRVEFSGAGNAERDWLEMSGIALNADGFVSVRTLTEGSAGGEAIISNARGWPSVGRLVQKRLVMAGLKSKPNSIIASVTGAPFDLNTELGVATAAFMYDIGENEANVIRDLFLSRTLIAFGSVQHAWLKNNVLSADDVPEFGFSDAPGITSSLRPVATNSAIFYVQAGKTSLQMLSYTEIEQNYVGDNASVLSANLIKDPVDMTRRRATDAIDSDILVIINGDGTATVLTLMRSQDVSGYAPWRTDGGFIAAQADQNNDVWLLVKRESDGTAAVRLEKMVPDMLLDEAETRTIGVSTATITGLERFNGRQIWAIADDQAHGPVPVAAGVAEFAEPLLGNVRIGSWVAPLAVDPPVYIEHETGRRQARLKRVNRLTLSLFKTTSVAISANGGEAQNLSMVNNDALIMGQGPLARPFTGAVEAEGMHGFTAEGQSTVTQTFPGTLTVRRASKDIVA